jgi:hypothetical protein
MALTSDIILYICEMGKPFSGILPLHLQHKERHKHPHDFDDEYILATAGRVYQVIQNIKLTNSSGTALKRYIPIRLGSQPFCFFRIPTDRFHLAIVGANIIPLSDLASDKACEIKFHTLDLRHLS